MKMKLYLCGPVSMGGTCTPEQEQENVAKFHDAEQRLAAAGYHVESPVWVVSFVESIVWRCAAFGLPGLPDGVCPPSGAARWQWYMRRTLIQMLTCHGVATLEHTEQSRGCIWELSSAGDLGMPIRTVDEWLALAAAVPDPQDVFIAKPMPTKPAQLAQWAKNGIPCLHKNVENVREWRGLDMDSGLFIGDCVDCGSTIKVEKP